MPEWLITVLAFVVPAVGAILWIGRLDGRVTTLETIEAERKGIIKDYNQHKERYARLEERVRALER